MRSTHLAYVCVTLSACAGTDDTPKTDTDAADVDADADSDSDADADSDADTDSDADSDVSPYGLDARPANPTCVAPARPTTGSQAKITRVFQGIGHSAGTMMTMAPGDTSQWYLSEQDGRIWRFDDDPAVSSKSQVLDIRNEVSNRGSEMGLLSFAFHPDFQTNHTVFAYYCTEGGGPGMDHEEHISKFVSNDGGATFDPGSEQVLLVIDHPYTNHNGGTILFGPDGFLYLGTGDGGSGGDPGDRAQDPFELLGKMLRIDVDSGSPYGIPADNPYATGGGRPEVFAIGLRNPFRYTFDPQSGDLWVGDVGQDAWEEVSKVERGGNYGWNIREGFACYSPSVGCPSAGLTPPYAVIEHVGFSSKSMIGGAVYHGSAIPSLGGTFLYNDFYDGDIIGLFSDPVTGLPDPQTVVANTGKNFVHYSVGADGELYLLEYNGEFYRLDPLPNQPVDTFPQTLSATGCFDPADPSVPVAGLIPYDVAHPFWSDGADKRRWMAVPDGQTITVGADGDWEFPIGSVLAKEFTDNGLRIETRLTIRHDDGGWAGYSYAWDEDGQDATLLAGGLAVDLADQTWSIPDNGECVLCHSVAAGSSLGLESMQLNTVGHYDATGRDANQLLTLDHIGMFTAPIGDPATLPAYAAVDDTAASLDDRARAYLHVNCAQCHRPDGPSRTDIDFRFSTPLADTHACGVAPEHGDLGVGGALVITPGQPAASLVSLRMHLRDANQMPPLGTNVVDDVGAALIDEWITSLSGCP
ncbi:MAG: PQQ-dependent sugar dehydrogenase [Myxococcota bacterium]